MANVLINDTYLKAIGDAIRSKLGNVLKYKPSEMATAINNIQSLKGGGYKVNITQSEHQTITVSQSSSTNKTTGFTIDDYPTIDISLKADPGYIAGVLNHTSFTFSNDVREVDIFATPATYSPNITYNGNMNVFLANPSGGDREALYISNRSSSEFGTLTASDIIQKSEFGLVYDPDFDMGYSNAGINNTNNFYNLSPNTTYKVSNLKIGDTTLTDDELSAYDNTITSNTIKWLGTASSWFNKVYMQCTGVDLHTKWKTVVLSRTLTSSGVTYIGNLGGFVFDVSFVKQSPDNFFARFYYKNQSDYRGFTSDMQTQIETNITNLGAHNIDNVIGQYYNLSNTSVLEEYMDAIKTLQTKFKDNQDALKILSKYTDIISEYEISFSLYKAFSIDKDNVCGLADALSYGLPQIYYCMVTLAFAKYLERVDSPIISTIPVSITFTNVTQ